MANAPAYFAHPLTTVSPRDLLLLEHLAPRPTDVALEVGVGSGSSLFQLAGAVAELHGLDIAAGPVERLRRAAARGGGPRQRLRFFVGDFSAAGAARRLPARYDLIYSCDTLEHVASPAVFWANLYQALKPGGRAFVAFPNEHPDLAHGITYFERREALSELVHAAGFAPRDTAIDVIRMTGRARRILRYGWYQPRRLAKIALGTLRKRRPRPTAPPAEASPPPTHPCDAPQTFDQTDFYRLGNRLEWFAPLVNAYCWGLLRLASRAAPVYQVLAAPEVLWNTAVLVRAVRGAGENPGRRGPEGEGPEVGGGTPRLACDGMRGA
jgi:SAM-dependent methyltransferase